jgi:hypothetical protein
MTTVVDASANPFRSSRILAFRYRFLESDWDGLLAQLEAMGMRGAIVGPEGTGKTTLLEDLGERLQRSGRRILLLDGADPLSRREWRDVLRRASGEGGLVVTAHREGFLPTLLRTRTTPEILDAAVVSASGRGCASFGVSPEELWTRHGGNVRTAIRELYDICAGRQRPDVCAGRVTPSS